MIDPRILLSQEVYSKFNQESTKLFTEAYSAILDTNNEYKSTLPSLNRSLDSDVIPDVDNVMRHKEDYYRQVFSPEKITETYTPIFTVAMAAAINKAVSTLGPLNGIRGYFKVTTKEGYPDLPIGIEFSNTENILSLLAYAPHALYTFEVSINGVYRKITNKIGDLYRVLALVDYMLMGHDYHSVLDFNNELPVELLSKYAKLNLVRSNIYESYIEELNRPMTPVERGVLLEIENLKNSLNMARDAKILVVDLDTNPTLLNLILEESPSADLADTLVAISINLHLIAKLLTYAPHSKKFRHVKCEVILEALKSTGKSLLEYDAIIIMSLSKHKEAMERGCEVSVSSEMHIEYVKKHVCEMLESKLKRKNTSNSSRLDARLENIKKSLDKLRSEGLDAPEVSREILERMRDSDLIKENPELLELLEELQANPEAIVDRLAEMTSRIEKNIKDDDDDSSGKGVLGFNADRVRELARALLRTGDIEEYEAIAHKMLDDVEESSDYANTPKLRSIVKELRQDPRPLMAKIMDFLLGEDKFKDLM